MRTEDVTALIEIDGMVSGSTRATYLQSKARAALDPAHGMVISLVAEVDRRVVGFLMGDVCRGDFGIPESVATVSSVAVHPNFQSAGIGGMLIREFVTHTEQLGVERIRTIVDWHGQWDLVEYFRAAGFAPAGTSIVLERQV